jgi:hypothetical protein
LGSRKSGAIELAGVFYECVIAVGADIIQNGPDTVLHHGVGVFASGKAFLNDGPVIFVTILKHRARHEWILGGWGEGK